MIFRNLIVTNEITSCQLNKRKREKQRERKRGRKREGKAGGERPLEFYVQPLQQRQRGEGGEDWGRGGEFH